MMKSIIFYHHFIENIKDFLDGNGIEAYHNAGKWTHIITKNNEGLSLIDKALLEAFPNANIANEYYRIDNCIYENLAEGYKKDGEFNYHQWRLLAAVEHENAWNDWSDELVKLAYIQCPLRVVISYGDYNPEKEEYTNAIHHANKVAEAINLKRYIHDDEEFVLIFGPRISSINDEKDIAKLYKAYIWNGEFFQKL